MVNKLCQQADYLFFLLITAVHGMRKNKRLPMVYLLSKQRGVGRMKAKKYLFILILFIL